MKSFTVSEITFKSHWQYHSSLHHLDF